MVPVVMATLDLIAITPVALTVAVDHMVVKMLLCVTNIQEFV